MHSCWDVMSAVGEGVCWVAVNFRFVVRNQSSEVLCVCEKSSGQSKAGRSP